MIIAVHEASCIGCGMCVLICPEEALEVASNFVVEIEQNRCTCCLICLNMCPNDALEER
jgi:Pyruvate/2-oxoacid:ferredoxin oxidoreductase delta subunit